MSEKLYSWFLRLYPSRFREEYGEEALQLFRDRARDEKGFFERLRLWLDLVADLAMSVPREYYHFQPEFFGVSAERLEGVPAFFVLESGSPRPGALFSGGLLTLASVITFSVWLSQPARYKPFRALASQSQSRAREHPSAVGRAASHRTDSAREKPSALRPSDVPATNSKPTEAKAGDASSGVPRQDSRFSPPPPPPSHPLQPQAGQPDDAADTTILIEDEDPGVNAAERHRVINGAIANLKLFYVYPDRAQKVSEALQAHERNGDYDGVTSGKTFADVLTKEMRGAGQDMHLVVVYSETPLPERPRSSTVEDLVRYRDALEQQNCTFEKVEILPRNIGYLKLNAFPDPSVCESRARKEMKRLNDADAIIFDLRENRGGSPDMVMLMAAYLFDHPEYMYSPRENTTERSWTRSPVPGNKLADKPAYLLTSASTFSAAEHFSYDMKMLKRATIVGETTSGAPHSGVFHRIDEHFGMGIPETKPINPFSKSDWVAVGVEPDVKVKAAEAFETAIKLAEIKLGKK